MAINLRRDMDSSRKRTLAGSEMTGIVVDDKDPEKNERIKVRVKGIHDDISDEDLPWARSNRSGASSNGGDTGSIGPIPKKGTAVSLRYPDDSMYNGIYSSTATGDKQQSAELYQGKDTTGNDYPHVSSNIDTSGNRVTYNNKKDTIDIEHVSGTHYSIDGKGHMSIKIADKKVGEDAQERNSKGFSITVVGPVNIRCSGDAQIGADGDVNIISRKNVNIGAEGKINLFSKGDTKINGANVHLNDGSGSMPKMADVKEPPSRKRPNPSLEA